MKVEAVKTRKVRAGEISLFDLLDEALPEIRDGNVVVITSKVAAICESRVVPIDEVNREELIKQEADYYLPSDLSKYGYNFSITKKTLVASAGIDMSNGDGNYILWPQDPQKSANEIRKYIKDKFGLKKIGVLISDSTAFPLRYGTLVIPLSHSGFLARHDYRGQPDLFGRPFKVSISSVAGGLAAAAGIVMGEGTEQTPIVIIEDIPFVQFQDRDPTQKELDEFYISMKDEDLFAPFLNKMPWQKGQGGTRGGIRTPDT